MSDISEVLHEVERRAFRIARSSCGNEEDAMDIVQDAMISLVTNYSSKPVDELRPLFFRILSSKIMDWHRKQSVSNRFKSFFNIDEDSDEDPINNVEDDSLVSAADLIESKETRQIIESAMSELTVKQKQAVMYRLMEDMTISETAYVMNCSESSVKEHYSRALKKLKLKLKEFK